MNPATASLAALNARMSVTMTCATATIIAHARQVQEHPLH